MSQFTATIWPPLVPFVATPSSLRQAAPFVAAPAPPMIIPQPVAQSMNWAPAAPLPNRTTYVPNVTTVNSTLDFFGIVNQNRINTVNRQLVTEVSGALVPVSDPTATLPPIAPDGCVPPTTQP